MPPARVYAPSPRSFDGRLRSPDYPNEAQVRRVRHCGTVKWRGQEVFLSQALTGEPIGLFASGDELWLVKYGPLVLGTMKGKEDFVRIAPPRPLRSEAG